MHLGESIEARERFIPHVVEILNPQGIYHPDDHDSSSLGDYLDGVYVDRLQDMRDDASSLGDDMYLDDDPLDHIEDHNSLSLGEDPLDHIEDRNSLSLGEDPLDHIEDRNSLSLGEDMYLDDDPLDHIEDHNSLSLGEDMYLDDDPLDHIEDHNSLSLGEDMYLDDDPFDHIEDHNSLSLGEDTSRYSYGNFERVLNVSSGSASSGGGSSSHEEYVPSYSRSFTSGLRWDWDDSSAHYWGDDSCTLSDDIWG